MHGILADSVVDDPLATIPDSVYPCAVVTLAQVSTPMDNQSQVELFDLWTLMVLMKSYIAYYWLKKNSTYGWPEKGG